MIMTSAIECKSNKLIDLFQKNTFVSFWRSQWDSLFRCNPLFLPQLPNLPLPATAIFGEHREREYAFLCSSPDVILQPHLLKKWASWHEDELTCYSSTKWLQDHSSAFCHFVCSAVIVNKKPWLQGPLSMKLYSTAIWLTWLLHHKSGSDICTQLPSEIKETNRVLCHA